MKSVNQVIKYIEMFYLQSTQSPRSYFRNVECMEAELVGMEALYEFIVEDERTALTNSDAYFRFLGAKGYGALGFTNGPVEVVGTDLRADAPTMDEFAHFWREYLQSGLRLKGK